MNKLAIAAIAIMALSLSFALTGCASKAARHAAHAPSVASTPQAPVASSPSEPHPASPSQARPVSQSAQATPASPSPTTSNAVADRAWTSANKSHTEDSYQAFAIKYPGDPRATKAADLAGGLAWQRTRRAGSQEAYRDFLANYPDDPHAADAMKDVRSYTVSLTRAISNHWITASACGTGAYSVALLINRSAPMPMKVTVPPGTYFKPNGNFQDMISCQDSTADLTRSASTNITVVARCGNFYKPGPGPNDGLAILESDPNPDVRALMAVIAQEKPSPTASQLALWSITDNPSRDEVGSVGEGSAPGDFQQAAHLIRAAGIDPTTKRMFQGS